MVIIQVTSEFSIFIVHSCYKHIHHTYTHTEKNLFVIAFVVIGSEMGVNFLCVLFDRYKCFNAEEYQSFYFGKREIHV